MQKTLALQLNKFPRTPNSLRVTPADNKPLSEMPVQLASLYHHYYLDSHGKAPPNPDPAQFEHLEFLLPCAEFRVRGDGIGVSTAIRRNRSNEFGHAFCRWFLYEHLNITYFAHIEHVLRRGVHHAFGAMRIERNGEGDTPDYFCAESVDKIFLAEAKGRHTSVSFGNAEFGTWRKQFDRVIVKDSSGHPRAVKGFIVAIRFGTEDKPSVKSTLFAEDPATPGEGEFSREEAGFVGARILMSHYSEIASKLNQPILAAALLGGFTVPEDIVFPATVWEFRIPPLQGLRFVGGYFPPSDGRVSLRLEEGKIITDSEPFRLDLRPGTFFGVEEKIFQQLVTIVRNGPQAAANVSRLPDFEPIYSGVSLLRDGSIIGPLDFFTPVDRPTFK